MKHVVFFLLTIAIGLVVALAQAATLAKLYAWFVMPQYGVGPSLATWYGISTIATLLIVSGTSHIKSTAAEKSWGQIFTDVVGRLIGLPILLGLAWLAGKLFGWL